MMSKAQFDMLRFISQRPITRTDLARDIKPRDVESRLNLVRALVKLGYVRDYGSQQGRRVPVNLRIWGITDAGRAVLEQQVLAQSADKGGQGQFGLRLAPKEPLAARPAKPLEKLKIKVKESKHGVDKAGPTNSLSTESR